MLVLFFSRAGVAEVTEASRVLIRQRDEATWAPSSGFSMAVPISWLASDKVVSPRQHVGVCKHPAELWRSLATYEVEIYFPFK